MSAQSFIELAIEALTRWACSQCTASPRTHTSKVQFRIFLFLWVSFVLHGNACSAPFTIVTAANGLRCLQAGSRDVRQLDGAWTATPRDIP